MEWQKDIPDEHARIEEGKFIVRVLREHRNTFMELMVDEAHKVFSEWASRDEIELCAAVGTCIVGCFAILSSYFLLYFC